MRSLVVSLAFVFACGGSSSGTGGPDASGGMIDGSGGGSGSGSGSGNVACKPKVTAVGSGHHNQGQDCMNSCHNHGFTLAGTLYNAAGTSPLSGATITVKDAAGHTIDLVSQGDGNFYTSSAVTFPATVVASECELSQTPTPMVMALTSANRGCNQSGCHTSSGQGRIHLP
jgi:hypothetical protein